MSSVSGVVQVDMLRADAQRTAPATDRVAEEAPLEVRLHGEPFSVIMRTPGADQDLTAGFLFTEGVVRDAHDIVSIKDAGAPNVVNVTLAPRRAAFVPDLLGQRRQVAMNSSCGMCGRRTLESLEVDAPPLASRWAVTTDTIRQLPERLRGAQCAFTETGGLHAAGVFDTAGRLELSAEDVGRHNAVDKLLGRLLMAGRLPLEDSLLFVSGRSSFEIVQKAFLGGLPLVAAVSAPSSLAIELAERTGITLLGFVRGDRFNLYAHPERVNLR
ncbi:MAG: formate dehydrogenase accessory sulfurtransferase FdhD [Vicinamibacterales bacterium]